MKPRHTARRLIGPIAFMVLFSAAAADAPQSTTIDVTGYWTEEGSYRMRNLGEHHSIAIAESSGTLSLDGAGVRFDGLKTRCYWQAEFSSWADIRCAAGEDDKSYLLFHVLMKIDRNGVSAGSAEILSGQGAYANVSGRFSVTWAFDKEARDERFKGNTLELKGAIAIRPGQ